MCRYCNLFNDNVCHCPTRAAKSLDFVDTTPGTNFILFAGSFPNNDYVLEHTLICHSHQVFVNYDCSSLKDGFDLGYS